jgi:serine/threonine-protein kinase
MGVVYLADDVRLSRKVALKALTPGLAREQGSRDRLKLEARAAAGLSHPGIAAVYALEEIEGELYLACEYVPGVPLRALLESGPLPPEQVVKVGVQLASALAAAHTEGVIHRDIKPENVVKTPSGVIKVLDFGLARIEGAADVRLTQTGMIVGTPAYLAPEQALGRPADFRTDLFSLGLLLYELATGTNPFVAKTVGATIARIVEVDPPPLSDAQSGWAPELDRIIATCLRKNPAERYASTLEVVADLERLQAELSGQHAQASSRKHPSGAIPRREDALAPRLWWERHQYVVSAVYVLMMYPAWRVRGWLPTPWGMVFLLCVLAAAAAAASLRLHLLFVARYTPEELAEQHVRTRVWSRLCDIAFAAFLIGAAIGIGRAHPEIAMLLVVVASVILIAAFIIEPTTARAAFKASARSA